MKTLIENKLISNTVYIGFKDFQINKRQTLFPIGIINLPLDVYFYYPDNCLIL